MRLNKQHKTMLVDYMTSQLQVPEKMLEKQKVTYQNAVNMLGVHYSTELGSDLPVLKRHNVVLKPKQFQLVFQNDKVPKTLMRKFTTLEKLLYGYPFSVKNNYAYKLASGTSNSKVVFSMEKNEDIFTLINSNSCNYYYNELKAPAKLIISVIDANIATIEIRNYKRDYKRTLETMLSSCNTWKKAVELYPDLSKASHVIQGDKLPALSSDTDLVKKLKSFKVG